MSLRYIFFKKYLFMPSLRNILRQDFIILRQIFYVIKKYFMSLRYIFLRNIYLCRH